MDSGWLIAIEMLFVLGLVLAFGGWQLWSVRRDQRASEDEDEKS